MVISGRPSETNPTLNPRQAGFFCPSTFTFCFPLGLVTSLANCLTSYCEVDKDNGLEGIITLGGRNISMLVTLQEVYIIYKCFNQGNKLI